jgi:hypothetical protein
MRFSGELPAQGGDNWFECMTDESCVQDAPQGFFLSAEMIRQ